MPSFLDCSRTCRSTLGPTCKEIWRLPSQWPSVSEVYCGGDRAKTSGKGPKKFKNQKKGNVAQVEGSSSGGTVQVV